MKYNVNILEENSGVEVKSFEEVMNLIRVSKKVSNIPLSWEVRTGSGGLMEINSYIQKYFSNHLTSETKSNRKGVAPSKDASFVVTPYGNLKVKYESFFDDSLIEPRKFRGLPISSYNMDVYLNGVPKFEITITDYA